MSTDQVVPPLLVTLLERLQGRETSELELKSAKGGLPNSLWETISAFANTSGGWILLGVKEENKKASVEGLANPSNLLDDFYSALRNPLKINYAACGPNDANIETLGEHQIIVIRVPEAPRQQRPVYIKGNPYTGTYVRQHTGDYHCTKPEVDRMMREASTVGADSAILTGYTLADIDKDSLARYRRMDQTLHPGEPRSAYDDLRFIKSIGGYRQDRKSGQHGLTVAGLLMLGTNQAIREWRKRHLIDYRLVNDDHNLDQRRGADLIGPPFC